MRVAFFVTCLVDQFYAEAGMAAVNLLKALGCEVHFPREQTCCGQPAFNAGYWDAAKKLAHHTLQVLKDEEFIVLPSGSCTAMIRHFYPLLFRDNQDALTIANHVASRTFELSEFVVKIVGCAHLGLGLQDKRIAYHPGCHALRELNSVKEPLTLLQNAGASIVSWPAAEECCGFGGVFAVKQPEVSLAMADRKLDTLPLVDFLASGDAGCLMQLQGRAIHRGLSVPICHLASVLWEAHHVA